MKIIHAVQKNVYEQYCNKILIYFQNNHCMDNEILYYDV